MCENSDFDISLSIQTSFDYTYTTLKEQTGCEENCFHNTITLFMIMVRFREVKCLIEATEKIRFKTNS